MLTKKDIYTHLKNGGSVDDLFEALTNEIESANARIEEEELAEAKKREAAEKVEKAKEKALEALVDFCKEAALDYNKKDMEHLLNLLVKGDIVFRWSNLTNFDGFVFP